MKKWLQKSDLLYIALLVLFLLAAGLDVVRTRSNRQLNDNTSTATATETTGTTATTATTPPVTPTGNLRIGYYDAVDAYLTQDHKGKTADIVNEIAKDMGRSVDWVALKPDQKAENIELLADPLTAVRSETGAMLRSKPYDVIDYRVRGPKSGAVVASPTALIDYVKVFYPSITFVADGDGTATGRVVRPSEAQELSTIASFQVPAVIGIAPGNPELLAAVNAVIDRRLKRPAA